MACAWAVLTMAPLRRKVAMTLSSSSTDMCHAAPPAIDVRSPEFQPFPVTGKL